MIDKQQLQDELNAIDDEKMPMAVIDGKDALAEKLRLRREEIAGLLGNDLFA